MVVWSGEMEFTPKKQAVGLTTVSTNPIARNPYASGGKRYMHKYNTGKHSLSTPKKQIYATPPRSRHDSRGKRMVASVVHRSAPAKPVVKSYENKSKNTQGVKRPFRVVNLQDSEDPYNIHSDSEDDSPPPPSKEPKNLNSFNKENISVFSDDEIFESSKEKAVQKSSEKLKPLFNTPESKPRKVYLNKRKSLFTSRSRLVGDISPEKVEKAYGITPVTVAEKENVPTSFITDSFSSQTSRALLPHMIGFPNYGNTCYLNSVLQSLLGLPTFLGDYLKTASELGLNTNSLFYGISQVLNNRMKGQTSGVKLSLRTVKNNLERIDCSFSGFKMQDANEFLTKVLDTIKDEIDRCLSEQCNVSSESSSNHKIMKDIDEDLLLCGAKIETESEGMDNDILNTTNEKNSKNTQGVKRPFRSGVSYNLLSSDSEDDSRPPPSKEDDRIGAVDKDSDVNNKILSKSSELHEVNAADSQNPGNGFHNPIKDNFEFHILESYRCLGCEEVQGKNQEYFGLYVNLPEDEDRDTSIQDAIESYMEEDVRELKCEKCSHGTTSVVTSITKLPRILIIQLKRYEYNALSCESIKMSSKIHVNRWINLDKFMATNVAGPSNWNPETVSCENKVKEVTGTLRVRNLSSDLNRCESPKKDNDISELIPDLSPVKPTSNVPDNEDEELQMVMRRSMEDMQGGEEEDEMQRAIRMSLQDMGMCYTEEDNESITEQEEEKEEVEKRNGEHSYCLISVISHFGLTTNTGHYVSDVYNCDEESWFHYDDESVAKISESVVFAEGRQKNGYIFFYMHKDMFQKLKNKDKR